MRPVLHHGSLKTPVGAVRVAVGEAGIVRIALAAQDASAFLEELRGLAPPGVGIVRGGSARLEAALSQLADYFGGRRRRFSLALDLSGLTPFRRRVLEATAAIPWGTVMTYGELAERAGCEGAFRAVGGALGSNPIPIVIPCHRVIAAGRGLGGFSAGEDGPSLKRRLLAAEGVRL